MAEGKKAFIVYTDWIKYTNEMTYEQKGMWIDWCLKYCNDTNPDFPSDPVARFLCMLCQDILKRDLKKYEEKIERFKKVGKQYQNNDNENEEETTPNTETNTKPKTECVNSNKLLVNSNKLIVDDISSNNICEEETKKGSLEMLLKELQLLFGRQTTNKEDELATEMYNKYGYKTTLYEVKKYSDKTNPLSYTNTILKNQNEEKKIVRKCSWLKEFQENLKEED